MLPMNKEILARWSKKSVPTPTIVNVKGDIAEIYIYDVIGADMFGGVGAKDIADQIKSLKGVKKLDVRINSPGGDVFDGLAIYALLNNFAGTKTVYVDGLAASIASVIAMAGDSVVMQPESQMMIHSAWVVTAGNSKDLRKMAEQLDNADADIKSIYARRTGLNPEQLDALMLEETWMPAAKAVEMKFADAIQDPPKRQVAQASALPATKLSPVEVMRLRSQIYGR